MSSENDHGFLMDELDDLRRKIPALEQECLRVKNLSGEYFLRCKEREKELQCIYIFSDIVSRRDYPMERIFQAAVDLIPAALCEPAATFVKVFFDGKEFSSRDFTTTPVQYSCDLEVLGQVRGRFEVFVCRGTISEEEKKFLCAIASWVGRIIEGKNVEETVAELQRQKDAILNNIPDIAWLKDRDGHFLAVNQAFGKACGLSPEEIVGKNDFDIWPAELAERYREDDVRVMHSGNSKQIEERLRDSSGQLIWIETVKTPIFTEKGEIIGTTGIARDITDRKHYETALKESEERYRTLVENINIGIYRNTGGPEGRFIQANSAIARIFGYENRDEFMNVAVSALYENPRDRKKFTDELKLLGKCKDYELKLKRRDGQPIVCACTAQVTYDDSGEILWMDGVIEDVTERKRTEESLRQSEKRFRALVANLPGVVYRCALDADWTMEFMSEGVLELCGYPVSDFIHNKVRSYASVIYPEDRKLVSEKVRVGVELRKPYIIEYRIISAAGEIRWVYEKGQGILDEGGNVKYLDGAIFDITEEKRAGETLLRQKQALEEKNIALREVLEQIEIEKKQIIDNVVASAEGLVLPIVEKLKARGVPKKHLELLRQNIELLVSSFGRKISAESSKLTSREIEICNLVKNGFTCKEAAEYLHISMHTVEKHRLNIRKKLGLTKKGFNLVSYLKKI